MMIMMTRVFHLPACGIRTFYIHSSIPIQFSYFDITTSYLFFNSYYISYISFYPNVFPYWSKQDWKIYPWGGIKGRFSKPAM
jgi:hypothetical protein